MSERVREWFENCFKWHDPRRRVLFFDEVDAIGGTRFGGGGGNDNEVQRTMLEIVNQLDGFDPRGNVKVLMATNRPDTHRSSFDETDVWIVRSSSDTNLKGRTQIFKIHTKRMSCDRNIRFELLARLCRTCTGAELRSVCTEGRLPFEPEESVSAKKICSMQSTR